MRANEFITEAVRQRLDPKCWTGKKIGNPKTKVKGGVRVNNCVPAESIAEDTDQKCPPATQDIALNLKNRQKAIDEYGYGPLNPDMPNAKFWMQKVDEWNLDSADEAKQSLCGNCAAFDVRESTLDCIAQGIDSESPEDAAGVIDAGDLGYCKFLKFKCASRRTCDAWVTGGPLTDELTTEQKFDMIEDMVESLAAQHGVDSDMIWEDFESVDDHELLETAAWRRKEGKSKSGGLNAKGVASYRRENPGSKLQTAVTTKPSKLKKGSKAAKRRKSFCARMSGVKGPMKKPNGKPTRKALALRKWNCESVEHMVDMIIENMDHDRDNSAVPELKSALLAKKQQLQRSTDDQVYDIIDSIMTRIARSHGISGQKLHDMWTAQYDQIPDTWIMK